MTGDLRDQVAEILIEHPTLHRHGFGRDIQHFDANRETLAKRDLPEIQACIEWLQSEPCWSGGSYRGKHEAERSEFAKGEPIYGYIPTGALIVAAMLLNRFDRTGADGCVTRAAGVECRKDRKTGEWQQVAA